MHVDENGVFCGCCCVVYDCNSRLVGLIFDRKRLLVRYITNIYVAVSNENGLVAEARTKCAAH